MGLRATCVWVCLVAGAGCSTFDPDPSEPGEEEMYADDDVGGGGDGVLVQCGNLSEANAYWQALAGAEPMRVVEMPVVCVGTIDTPGFDYESAVPIDGSYEFPEWDDEIKAQCEAACEAAHQTETNEMPVCLQENFAPNWAVGTWEPADGANCDSSILPDVRMPEILVKIGGVP